MLFLRGGGGVGFWARASAALRLYEAALRRHPQGPPAIRLGIALCHFKLGNLDRAKAAFRRVLQLEPTNVEAFVGLAVRAARLWGRGVKGLG